MALPDPVDYFFNPESESPLLLTSPLLILESSDLAGNHDCVSTSCNSLVSPAVPYLLAPIYPKAIKKKPQGAQDLPKRHCFNVRQDILGQWGHSFLLWTLQYHKVVGGHDWGTAAHAGLWRCWICAVHSSAELLPRQTTVQNNRKVEKEKKEITHYTCQDDKDWARSSLQVRAGAVWLLWSVSTVRRSFAALQSVKSPPCLHQGTGVERSHLNNLPKATQQQMD